jgi:hypothetical protein
LQLVSPSECYRAAKYRGYWVPRSRYGLSVRRTHGPAGLPSSTRVQGRDSLDNPLVGFTSTLRPNPTSPPWTSRSKAPLLGFYRPYNARAGESPRLAGCPVELPGFAGSLSADPTLPTTVPLAGFPNLLAAFFLSPTPCHFQTGGVRGVRLYRELFLPRNPGCSSPPVCPLAVPPAGCAVPVPRRGHLQAQRPIA